MGSDKTEISADARPGPRSGVLVGRRVTIRAVTPAPEYFTDLHQARVGQTGRVHAIVPTAQRDNPLVKVGFEEGTQIIFFRASELEVHDDEPEIRKHGQRASHLPKREST
jgi:hypothetical protein